MSPLDAVARLALKQDRATLLGACPNPRCLGGNVPGGSLGFLLCPDCVREGRVKVARVTIIGGADNACA